MQCLWHIVAAVLQLGQVEYSAGKDGNATIKDAELITKISKVMHRMLLAIQEGYCVSCECRLIFSIVHKHDLLRQGRLR